MNKTTDTGPIESVNFFQTNLGGEEKFPPNVEYCSPYTQYTTWNTTPMWNSTRVDYLLKLMDLVSSTLWLDDYKESIVEQIALELRITKSTK